MLDGVRVGLDRNDPDAATAHAVTMGVAGRLDEEDAGAAVESPKPKGKIERSAENDADVGAVVMVGLEAASGTELQVGDPERTDLRLVEAGAAGEHRDRAWHHASIVGE